MQTQILQLQCCGAEDKGEFNQMRARGDETEGGRGRRQSESKLFLQFVSLHHYCASFPSPETHRSQAKKGRRVEREPTGTFIIKKQHSLVSAVIAAAIIGPFTPARQTPKCNCNYILRAFNTIL